MTVPSIFGLWTSDGLTPRIQDQILRADWPSAVSYGCCLPLEIESPVGHEHCHKPLDDDKAASAVRNITGDNRGRAPNAKICVVTQWHRHLPHSH